MRDLINIILNEVTLSKDKYGPGQKFIISNSQAGQVLSGSLANQGLAVEGPIELTNKSTGADTLTMRGTYDYRVRMGTGNDVYEFRTEDDIYFYVIGTTGTIGPALNVSQESKLANRGEISEGILGAAMFVKFTKRQPGEEVGVVTPADITNVLDNLQTQGNDTYSVTVNDADSEVADTISFVLRLKTAPYQDLMNPLKRPLIANELASAAAYVNSQMAERYSKYFYLNGKADEINIMADGAASESEKKSDVWVGIRDKNGAMRTLKLNASLKVGGIGQFGQVGGSGIDSMTKLFGYFGIDISPYVSKFELEHKKDQFKAIEYMYRQITDDLQSQLAGNNDTEEARFVDQIAHAVTHFATLGDSNVELVDFNKGGFKILRFKNLEYKLRTIDLTASYTGKTRPEISIHDVQNPKRELISIRCKIENKKTGPYVRNIIEKGPLLEELTEVQERSFKELELPDPEKTRLQIRPKGRRAEVQDKDSTPRQKRDK
jgi:hypothetical protein